MEKFDKLLLLAILFLVALLAISPFMRPREELRVTGIHFNSVQKRDIFLEK